MCIYSFCAHDFGFSVVITLGRFSISSRHSVFFSLWIKLLYLISFLFSRLNCYLILILKQLHFKEKKMGLLLGISLMLYASIIFTDEHGFLSYSLSLADMRRLPLIENMLTIYKCLDNNFSADLLQQAYSGWNLFKGSILIIFPLMFKFCYSVG